MESYDVTIQMKPLGQYFHLSLFVFQNLMKISLKFSFMKFVVSVFWEWKKCYLHWYLGFCFCLFVFFFFSGPPQQNVKTVSGGVGTIKRKREIRELLEQQDMNYEDDIFDATPFKKKKDIKVCWTAIQIKSPQLFFISFSLSAFYSSTSTNKPFYRHDVSTLAFEWTWGRCWPCFDKNLFTFLMTIMLKILVRMRTTWLTL